MPAVFIKPFKVGITIIKQRLITHLNVLCHKVTIKGIHIFQYFMVKVGVLPVAGHYIYAQQITGLNHIHTTCLVGGTAPLPSITAIQQQAITFTRFSTQLINQGLHMGKTTHLAVAARRLIKA